MYIFEKRDLLGLLIPLAGGIYEAFKSEKTMKFGSKSNLHKGQGNY